MSHNAFHPALKMALIALALVRPVSAETVTFPKDHPIFTIELQEGWSATFGTEGALFLHASERSGIELCKFSELPSAKVNDPDSARKYLEAILKNCNSTTNLWNMVYAKSLSKNIKSLETLCESSEIVGLSYPPVGVLSSATVFSFDGKKYFLMKSLSRGDGGIYGLNWGMLLTLQESIRASK